MLVLTLTLVLPIFYAVYQSVMGIKRFGAFGQGSNSQVFVGFDNYIAALSDEAFTQSLGRVMFFAAVQVPVMIVLATALALMLQNRILPALRCARSDRIDLMGLSLHARPESIH